MIFTLAYKANVPAPFRNHTGLDAVEKKFGQGKVDPAKQRGMNEKITDKARGMFEKATGYELFLGPFFLLFVGLLLFCIFRLWGCCCFVFSFCGGVVVCIGSGWALLVVGVVGASVGCEMGIELPRQC